MAFEVQVERQIRLAQAAGEFDALPGAGRPLAAEPPGEHDGTWWARAYVEREGLPRTVLLPTGLALKKLTAEVHADVAGLRTETEVVEYVEDLNRRIRAEIFLPSAGPPVILSEIEPAAVVERWREERARREADRVCPRPDPDPPAARPARWWTRRREALKRI